MATWLLQRVSNHQATASLAGNQVTRAGAALRGAEGSSLVKRKVGLWGYNQQKH